MSSRSFHFWAQCQMLVLNFSVVNGMPISDTIHNQISWNRVQHLGIIKDMLGLTSWRIWGYNNFASVSQLIARFATQDESSCPKLSNAVTNAVTASLKAQFSQCKQLALTIHYGKECYLLSTSSSILTLRKQCTRPSVHSIYFITAMTQWSQHLAKQNLLKIKTWGTSVMIELSSDSQCRLMPSKQGSADWRKPDTKVTIGWDIQKQTQSLGSSYTYHPALRPWLGTWCYNCDSWTLFHTKSLWSASPCVW
jgi:hypothetical protein